MRHICKWCNHTFPFRESLRAHVRECTSRKAASRAVGRFNRVSGPTGHLTRERAT